LSTFALSNEKTNRYQTTMKKNSTPVLLGSLAIAAVMSAPAQAQDCNLTFTIEHDCYATDLGYALLTDIQSAISPWDYLWSTGATTQYVDGLGNGDYWGMLTDAAGCTYKVDFTIDCSKKEECELRTQTQGGWGTTANGNNPGTYRDAHFAAAFPNGITIGCTRTLSLTTSAAVRAFLPSGSTARMLNPGSMTNPGNSYRNVLAGQLVALTLSVGFDNHDPNFGASGNLGEAVINNGTFMGWTVNELLDEANSFIGGCGSMYSASQLNAALSMVNENFVDGTTNNGNLDCDGKKEEKVLRTNSTDRLSIYPNPATSNITVDLVSMVDGNVTIVMMDALGRVLHNSNAMTLAAGDQRIVNINVDALQNGSYFLTVYRNGEIMQVQRVVVSH
jgi:hypothetical protein